MPQEGAMTKNRTWVGMAFAVALVLAIGFAASCYSDSTSPSYTPRDTTSSDTMPKSQG
jgi:hypothetical protein